STIVADLSGHAGREVCGAQCGLTHYQAILPNGVDTLNHHTPATRHVEIAAGCQSDTNHTHCSGEPGGASHAATSKMADKGHRQQRRPIALGCVAADDADCAATYFFARRL